MSILQIQEFEVAQLKPYGKNARLHDKKQLQKIVSSIKEFKFTNPILIDENFEIIAGHGRLMAAKHLNMDKVPCIQLTYLSDEQKRAYRIADNQLTLDGKWDEDLLRLEISDLSDLDFDISLIGFETTELDLMLKSSQEVEDEKLEEIPGIDESKIVSKQGDVWKLGNHIIICGDALKSEVYEKLFANTDKRAQMIFTDPPFNVKIQGHVCGNGKVKHKEFAMASGEMTSDEFTNFLKTSFENLKEYSVDGSLHYICMDWRHIIELTSAGNDVYDEMKNLCVWNKDNGGMGSLYRSKHELVFLYKNGTAPHINNVELGSNGRYRTNVWDYAGVNSFAGSQDDLKFHPTVKPVKLVEDAILDVTKRGDVVLDSFLGSGSTLIACQSSGRVCYGIEYEPLYIDTIIKRWEKFTGKKAIHLESGKTSEEANNDK